jgi:hypothetical protein
MPILQATDSVTGLVGVFPNLVFINTNDTPATVLNVGYLNTAVQENLLQVNNGDMALIATVTAGVISVNWLQVKVTGTPGNFNYSLGAPTLLAALALGNFQAGEDGVAGGYISYPLAPASGFLELFATANTGAFNALITNAALGQTTTFTIPDPVAATANFLLDAGPGNLVTDYQQMLPITEFQLAAGGGVWVLTRVAQGNWDWLHTAAADTSVIGFDITEQLRIAAGRGFELTSFDVVYSITTLALVAHTVTLADVVYANNVAVAAVNRAITGVLATATQANPYLTNVTVDVPAFSNPAAGTSVKQVLELTVNAGLTSVYEFRGINLRFTKSIK